MTASNVMIAGNKAEGGDGGGIWTSASGSFTLLGATINNNLAQSVDSSGAGLFAGSHTGTLIITDSEIAGNFCVGPGAGGLQIEAGTATLANSTISDNDGGGGGGIHASAGTLQLLGVTVANNRAGTSGGGLHNDGAAVTLDDIVIDGNWSYGDGAGLYNSGSGSITAAGVVITNNLVARDGGGLHNSGSGSVTGFGVVITNNVADLGDGGGIWNSGSGTFSLLGATIAHNESRSGAGLFVASDAGTVDITESTISGNTAWNTGGGLQTEGGTITLANSTVSGNHADNGGGIFNAAGASLTITGGQIIGNSAEIAGGGLHNEGALTLDGVLINGNYTEGNGGGLYNSGSSSMTASNVRIADNTADRGGGIWTDASGTVSLLGATFDHNVAWAGGAGLFAGSNSGTLNITDSMISRNICIATGAGGLHLEGGTTMLVNSTVSDNSGDGGGGIHVGAGTLQLSGVTIAGNYGGGLHNTGAALMLDTVLINRNAGLGDGGGLHNSGSGSVIGSAVVITNNEATDGNGGREGGGVWTSGSGTFTLLDSTIAGNRARSGAGLFVASGAGPVNITDSTISDNHAWLTGGGLLIEGGTITLANSTVSGNHADNGGGIRANGGTLHLLSTTVAANAADENGGGVDQQGAAVFAQSTIIATNSAAVSAPDFRGTLQSNGFNLIGNTAGATIAGDTASDITNVDPRLGPLQDNGGPTKTHALLLGSPATNRGFNAAGAAFDQRGTPFTRSFAGATDIGAFELHLNADLFAVGAGPGGGPAVRVFDAATGQRLSSFFAFNPAFRGGVTVAAGDVTGDGFSEIVVGAGPGGGPVVRVFDGLTGAQIGEQILAFPLGFRGGVMVATGDLDGDGDDEIIVGAGPGGGPVVRVFDGTTGAPIGEHFFAFPIGFKGGVTVSAGDVDGDGDDEIIVGAGPGGGPAVRVFDGLTGASIGERIFAFPLSFRGGVRVAAVDVNDDGAAEILAGAGPGGGPALRIFDGGTRLPVGDPLFAFDPQFSGGIFVAGHIGDPEDLGAALRVDHSYASNGGSASDLTESDLSAVVAAAPTRLRQAGVSEETLARLANVEFAIGDLGGDRLALARPGLILLDDDAAGFGWFVDYSPLLDEEFFEDGSQLASLDGRASGRIDLLTAVLHEMGHALGLGHTEHPADDCALMSSTLPAGIRRLPDSEELDALFAAAEGLDLAAV